MVPQILSDGTIGRAIVVSTRRGTSWTDAWESTTCGMRAARA